MSTSYKFKTLSGKEYTLDIDVEKENVESIIQRLDKEHSISAAKLVVNGKILGPQDTFAGAGVQETQFVVVVPQKKTVAKPKPTTQPTTQAPQQQTTTQSTPAPAPQQTSTPAPQSTPQPTATAPTQSPSQPAMSSIPGVPQEEYQAFEDNLKNLTDMGFAREQAIRCLRAAMNDLSAASEFLLSGFIPEELTPLADGRLPMPTRDQLRRLQERHQQAMMQQQGGRAGGIGGGGNPLANLLGGQAEGEEEDDEGDEDDPLAQQLGGMGMELEAFRQVIQQNPQMLQPILQTIQQQNPELFNIIQQNPQRLIELLQGGGGAPPRQQGGGAGMGGMPPQGGRMTQPGTIHVTQEEAEAIARLTDLGFPRGVAAQAYFAFDKDENAAANFLFDQGTSLMADEVDMTGTGTTESTFESVPTQSSQQGGQQASQQSSQESGERGPPSGGAADTTGRTGTSHADRVQQGQTEEDQPKKDDEEKMEDTEESK